MLEAYNEKLGHPATSLAYHACADEAHEAAVVLFGTAPACVMLIDKTEIVHMNPGQTVSKHISISLLHKNVTEAWCELLGYCEVTVRMSTVELLGNNKLEKGGIG